MPSPRKVSPSPSVSACTSFLKERSIASTLARGRLYRRRRECYLRAAPVCSARAAELFDRDIRLANDAAVFLDLPAQVGVEFRAAHPDRKESLLGKLGFHVGGLERAAEPPGQPVEHVGRRLRRRHDTVKDLRLA